MAIPPDLRDPRRTEDALFRTIFEQSPVSTQIFSPDGKTLAVNRAWEELWGVTLAQIGEYNILQDEQLVAKGIMPFIRRGFAGEPTDIPAVKYEPDQTIPGVSAVPYRWVRAHMYPIKDEWGRIREVVLMHEDITEQKQAEEERRKSEEHYRTLVEMAPDVIYRISRDGTLAALSPAFETVTGWPVDEWLGKPFAGIVHPDDLPLAVARFEQTMRGETPAPYELHILSSSGEYLVGEFRTRPLIEQGKVTGKIGVARDITERKRVENALRLLAEENSRLYQRAQEALSLREEFLSIASHELKTPLTALQLQMQMLERAVRKLALDDRRRERVTQTIEGAARQVERLAKLTNQLLDVSRIAAGRLDLDREEVDLAALAREVAARFQDEQSAGGHARVSVYADAAVVGCWDRFRLDQVITNLLSNAVKYGNGTPIQVTVSANGDVARLTVADQGIGIAPQDLSRIFDRFERAVPVGLASNGGPPALRDRERGGLGLGLYICRQLVEAHGGTISVCSQVGKGSTFTVELPLTS